MELPPDLFHPPLAASVESDYSRHHYLHWIVGGWGTRPLGHASRHPLRNGGIDPFMSQPMEIRRFLVGQKRRRENRI